VQQGVFEDKVHDLHTLIQLAKGKKEQPSAAMFDRRTVQSTPYVEYCSLHMSYLPMSRNAFRLRDCLKQYKKKPNSLWKQPLWIKATQVTTSKMMQKKPALSWSSSNYLKPGSERQRNRRKRFGLRFNLVTTIYNLELQKPQ
jgi:hypothetical protein